MYGLFIINQGCCLAFPANRLTLGPQNSSWHFCLFVSGEAQCSRFYGGGKQPTQALVS